MILVTSSSAVFACHSAACAPPPAGQGGSISGARVGQSYHDRDHGPVTVSGVKARPGKPYDEVEITKADGSKAKVFPGRAGLAGRGRRAAAPRSHGSDDGYDAAKDAYLSGEGRAPSRAWAAKRKGTW